MSAGQPIDGIGAPKMAASDVEHEAAKKTSVTSMETAVVSYSVSTKGQKRLNTFLVGLGMLFSPMSANIYFPCVSSLQDSLHVRRQLVNLTITSYIVLQGIAPSFFEVLQTITALVPLYTDRLVMKSNTGKVLDQCWQPLPNYLSLTRLN